MPLFDYYCLDCETVYELIVPLDRLDEEVKCPECGKILKKRISPPRNRWRFND
jgi:putative FmdB family regulatory protein